MALYLFRLVFSWLCRRGSWIKPTSCVFSWFGVWMGHGFVGGVLDQNKWIHILAGLVLSWLCRGGVLDQAKWLCIYLAWCLDGVGEGHRSSQMDLYLNGLLFNRLCPGEPRVKPNGVVFNWLGVWLGVLGGVLDQDTWLCI